MENIKSYLSKLFSIELNLDVSVLTSLTPAGQIIYIVFYSLLKAFALISLAFIIDTIFAKL